MIGYIIKVTAVTSGKTKVFNSIKEAEDSTGISRHYFKKIRLGQHSHLIRGKKDILFSVECIDKDVVVTLHPAWDTSYDDTPVLPKSFTSHTSAINFLSEGGNYLSKKSSYNRRRNEVELQQPCNTPIKDSWGRPWIAVFYSKGEFIPNKR